MGDGLEVNHFGAIIGRNMKGKGTYYVSDRF